MTTRRATDNSKALDAFMTTKFQIDDMLDRLKTLSADHFETHPDEINWGHVGTLNQYASLLRQITDAAFKEETDGIIICLRACSRPRAVARRHVRRNFY